MYNATRDVEHLGNTRELSPLESGVTLHGYGSVWVYMV
jgi:hypothetical protein